MVIGITRTDLDASGSRVAVKAETARVGRFFLPLERVAFNWSHILRR